MDLAGAAVIVTGGTGGLGSRICQAFARQGSRVAVVYLEREGAARELCDQLKQAGAADAIPVQADVTRAEAIDQMARQVVAAWGRIDVLVNNAAFNQYVAYTDFDGLTEELWGKILHSNLTGPFLCCKAIGRLMQRQGNGRIVNIGSVAGHFPGGSSIAYAVSKAGLAHLTHCMAVALAPQVLVNGVAPGLMEGTRMTERLHPDQVRRSTETSALKRPADKDDVAEQVVVFARSDSTTGQNVIIDCGRVWH